MSRKQTQHAYYLRHKKKLNKQGREWYQKNRTKALARQKANYKKNRESTIQNRLLITAKNRAKMVGLAFDLSFDDLKLPKKCPVFNHSFELGEGKAGIWSPTVDRIIPDNGYVRQNSQIISMKANAIKGTSSLSELEARASKQAEALKDLRKVIRFLRKINTKAIL